MKPLSYDDMEAINHIKISKDVTDRIIGGRENNGKDEVVQHLVNKIKDIYKEKGKCTVIVDGYVGARFLDLVGRINSKIDCSLVDMKDLYRPKEEIDKIIEKNLPLNYDEDPCLLFGYLEPHTMDEFIDYKKLRDVLDLLKDKITILYGIGSSIKELRDNSEMIVYIDVTPKEAAIRARCGEVANIGDKFPRKFNLLMRRNYYVDFNVILSLRKELLKDDLIDYYITGSNDLYYFMLDKYVMNEVLGTLVKYPFRGKPVYLEGIWGGEFIRKVRHIPDEIASNIAWIFDFIPTEISIAVDCNGKYIEFPYYTFVQKKGLEIMGEKCMREFDGYFPLRFNYDDSWHSDGNMSIQVHPDEDYVIEHYNEFGRQDEAYYIIATGHGAKTYCGFRSGEDPEEFFKAIQKSEEDGSKVDYRKYINYIDSTPGRQIMIPSGTVHSSGQNQFILELGSLTIGSYTYKIYDYLRREKDGSLRPIHSKNAMNVAKRERNTEWVRENIAIDPILIDEKDDYKEYIVGKTDLMYYQTQRIEIKTGGRYEGKNNGQFTVCTLVDGEKCRISSKKDHLLSFDMSFLDIVCIPANIDNYVIENTGYQPIVVHKVLLKEDYTRYKNSVYRDRECV